MVRVRVRVRVSATVCALGRRRLPCGDLQAMRNRVRVRLRVRVRDRVRVSRRLLPCGDLHTVRIRVRTSAQRAGWFKLIRLHRQLRRRICSAARWMFLNAEANFVENRHGPRRGEA